MEEDLPGQLAWRDWVRILQRDGWSLYKNNRGSSRTFVHSNGRRLATFHEPHGKDPLRKGTLRSYLAKCGMTRERFFELYKQI